MTVSDDAPTAIAGQWERGTVASGGEDIYWERVRSGDPVAETVVLTHGAGGSHAVWFQQVPVLVAAGYDVITWDSRGFGNTSYRSGELSTAAAVTDLGAVLDHLGVDAVHLVGQSMGGWYVTRFAVAHPARVRSLALCDTIGSVFNDELRQVMADFRAGGGLVRSGPVTLGSHMAVTGADPTTAFLYQQLGTFHEPPLREVGRVLAESATTPAEVDTLGVPVLVLAGADDPIFPAPALSRLAGELDRARWVEIAGAGHSPYFEQPAAFNDALISFLDGVDRSGS